MSKELKLHPLLTAGENAHYAKDGKQTIQILEDRFTVYQMMAICEFNIYKYSMREKGQTVSDNNKATKYNDYLKELENINIKFANSTVAFAFENSGIKWNYAS